MQRYQIDLPIYTININVQTILNQYHKLCIYRRGVAHLTALQMWMSARGGNVLQMASAKTQEEDTDVPVRLERNILCQIIHVTLMPA
jgi:hypothetical protein